MKDTQMSLFGTPKEPKRTSRKQTTKRRRKSTRHAKHISKKAASYKRRPKKRALKRTSSHKETKHGTNKKVSNVKESSKQTKQLTKPKSKPKTVLTQADKAYQRLVSAKLAIKCHIFKGGEPCESIALSYCNPNQIHVPLGESMNRVCHRSSNTKPYCYYHCVNGHFIQYNGWLMNQIYKYRDDIK